MVFFPVRRYNIGVPDKNFKQILKKKERIIQMRQKFTLLLLLLRGRDERIFGHVITRSENRISKRNENTESMKEMIMKGDSSLLKYSTAYPRLQKL